MMEWLDCVDSYNTTDLIVCDEQERNKKHFIQKNDKREQEARRETKLMAHGPRLISDADAVHFTLHHTTRCPETSVLTRRSPVCPVILSNPVSVKSKHSQDILLYSRIW